ncbi:MULTISPECIES: hypothetical protein, partial [Halorussus]|uniref:hypothetical protein n=1 Tax=Halorussus sp. JP-T4 TaxID=2716718 RepID=UPI0013B42621
AGAGATASARFEADEFGGARGRADRARPDDRRPRRDGASRREDSPRRGAGGEPHRREGDGSAARREEAPAPRRDRDGHAPRSRRDDRRPRREGTGRAPPRERDARARQRTADRPRGDADSRRDSAASPRSDADVRESAPEPPREPVDSQDGADAGPRADAMAAESTDDEPAERQAEAPAGADEPVATGATDSESGGATADGAVLSVDRRLETTEPARTHGVRERVTVRNEGDAGAESVRASFPDETVAVGDVPPGDSATIQRHHAFADVGTVELPAATVAGADATCEVPAERVSVEPADLAAEVVLDPVDGGYQVRVDLANGRDVDCTVERIGTRDLGIWDVDLRVPAGESVEWTRDVEGVALEDPATETVVEYQFADGEPDRLGTLGRVTDASAAPAEGVDALAADVGDETRVSGGYGSVVLVVENRGESPVADLSVAATGEAVSDLMYGGSESVDGLAPGERFTHFVDVETEGPEATVTVALSADDGETELELRGPAPADEDDWSEAALADWTVERDDDADDGGADHLVSRFEDV